MKHIHIHHRTVYRYAAPVRFGLHRMVLRPREGHDVTVLSHSLSTDPSAQFFWLNDLFGNNVALAEFSAPADRLEIVSDVVIERFAGAGDSAPRRVTRSSVVALPVVYPQMELPVVQGYIAPVYEPDQPAVSQWLASLPAPPQKENSGPGPSALEMVELVNREINRQIRYRRREEAGVQSPAVTLSLQSGSCRDQAVLLMEAVRSLGIAARFVSGYFDGAAAQAGRGATHAWTDVYLPDTGWCGFDPTIGAPASLRHIPLGVSAHPRGVMPISGIFSGPPASYLGMEVTVTIKEPELAATVS